MISRSVVCPGCSAPLALTVAQRLCECTACGSRFAVDWSDVGVPRLTSFDAILEQRPDAFSLQKAEERLTQLETAIAQAEQEVKARHSQVEGARLEYQSKRVRVQEVISPWQNLTYVAGLLAFTASFVSWFVLHGSARTVALAVVILFLVMGWAFHSKWLGAEAWAQGELRQVNRAVEHAEAQLSAAYGVLEDHMLERELRLRQVSGYQHGNRDASES